MIKTIRKRLNQLKQDRSTWEQHWKELRDMISPWAGVFPEDNPNSGQKKADPIVSAGREALRVLSSGMQGGLTPRSVRWFGLKMHGKGGSGQTQIASEWLDRCTQLILDILAKSNFYHVQGQVYESLALFGTAAMYMEDDYDTVVRFRFLSVGEYWIADNWKGEVDTLIREFDMSARNVAEEFGMDACSASLQNLAKESPDKYVRIIHAVMPRHKGKKDASFPVNMPFMSVYFEKGASDNDKPLRVSGYKTFPFLVPRWKVRGADAWGHSPAMDALADLKMAKDMLTDVMGMVRNISHPPLQAPDSIGSAGVKLDPGEVTYIPTDARGEIIRPILTTEYDVTRVMTVEQQVEEKIRRAFHHEIFMMFAGDDKNMTATEIMERKQERLIQLGPVLDRMQTEIFAPLIKRIFERCQSAGILPFLSDKEAGGGDIEIEYTSALSQAQNLSRVTNIQQFAAQIGQLAQVKPEVLEMLDADAMTRKLSEYLNVPPEMLHSAEEVEAMRMERQAQEQAAMQQQEAMQGMQALEQGANVAEKAGRIDMGENTAFTQLIGALGG